MYIHAYIHTCIHTYIHTYKCTQTHAQTLTCIHTVHDTNNLRVAGAVFSLEKSPSAHKTTPLINYITEPFIP